MNPAVKYRVVEVEQTTDYAPAQWEGRTDDNRPVYGHYRTGILSVEIGEPGQSVDDELPEVFQLRVSDDPLESGMTFEELKAHTAGVIEWPAELTE